MVLCKAEHAKTVDSKVFPGMQGGPLMHVIAAKAVAFGEALEPGFKTYAKAVIKNAQMLAKAQHGRQNQDTGMADLHTTVIIVKSVGNGAIGQGSVLN